MKTSSSLRYVFPFLIKALSLFHDDDDCNHLIKRSGKMRGLEIEGHLRQ